METCLSRVYVCIWKCPCQYVSKTDVSLPVFESYIYVKSLKVWYCGKEWLLAVFLSLGLSEAVPIFESNSLNKSVRKKWLFESTAA